MPEDQISPTLTENRTSRGLAPVLVPCLDATQAHIERVTQDPLVARNIPQGARILYAQRPARPPAREAPCRMPMRPDTHWFNSLWVGQWHRNNVPRCA